LFLEKRAITSDIIRLVWKIPKSPQTSFGECRGMQDGKSRPFEERIGKEKRGKKERKEKTKQKKRTTRKSRYD
jgi:hypothetical protein